MYDLGKEPRSTGTHYPHIGNKVHLSFFLYGQFVPKFVSRRQSSQLGVSTQLWGVSFIWCRVKIDYRSLSCTRIDRIPLSSESLSRQSTQSTVHTAVPGDLLAMGKILRWYPEDLFVMQCIALDRCRWPRQGKCSRPSPSEGVTSGP